MKAPFRLESMHMGSPAAGFKKLRKACENIKPSNKEDLEEFLKWIETVFPNSHLLNETGGEGLSLNNIYADIGTNGVSFVSVRVSQGTERVILKIEQSSSGLDIYRASLSSTGGQATIPHQRYEQILKKPNWYTRGALEWQRIRTRDDSESALAA
jgi:hypothetical protein